MPDLAQMFAWALIASVTSAAAAVASRRARSSVYWALFVVINLIILAITLYPYDLGRMNLSGILRFHSVIFIVPLFTTFLIVRARSLQARPALALLVAPLCYLASVIVGFGVLVVAFDLSR